MNQPNPNELNERDAEDIIDRLLEVKGWNANPKKPPRNVYRHQTYYYQNEDGEKKWVRPDYVFYDNSNSPLCVLEVKKPNTKLHECLEQAKKACRVIVPNGIVPLAIASDGFVYLSYHLIFQKEYLINNKPLNNLPTPQELVEVHTSHTYTSFRGKVLTSQEDFRKFLKTIENKLWEEGLKKGDERFTEFCKLLFLRLTSSPNDPNSSWNNITAQLKTNSNIKAIIKDELSKKQGHYKIGKYASSLKIKSPIIIKEIIEEINKIDFAQSDFDAKGVIFEYFLNPRGNDDLAQYFTPRTIVRFMVNFLSPKLGEKIYDPFCGSGGMLIESFEFLRKQIPLNKKEEENFNYLRKKTFYGNDVSTVAYVAKLNMILAGDGYVNIRRRDSLEHKIEKKFDVAITNIPFNLTTKFGVLYKFPTDLANSVCVQHLIASLKEKPSVRAGIIVPHIFLTDNKYQNLRKDIFDSFTITLISLPSGTFEPYTGGRGYILFIDKKVNNYYIERERERERERETILSSITKSNKWDLPLTERKNPLMKMI